MNRGTCVALALVPICLAACGCRDAADSRASDSGRDAPRQYPYNVVCTVGMVSDMVRHVAGDKAAVEGLIGEGVDPHLFQASRSDILKLTQADFIFYNGLLLEGKMTDALIAVGRRRPVHAVTTDLEPGKLLEPPEFAGHADPHVWMDPLLWKACAAAAATALGEFDPPNADVYRENAAAYARQLDKLHEFAAAALATIPEESRVLVTAHDAFNYFARRYGLEVRGIQGISTESEAGIKDINDLVDLLVDRKVRAVFVESSVSDKNVRALVEGAAARNHPVRIGGTLYSDAMGPPGTYEGTYIGMIDHNVTTIVKALGGKVAPGGMQGKLRSGE